MYESARICRTHLVVIAVLTYPFCRLPCIAMAQAVVPDMKTGVVRGTVFVINSDGGRSVVKWGNRSDGRPWASTQTLTDEPESRHFS